MSQPQPQSNGETKASSSRKGSRHRSIKRTSITANGNISESKVPVSSMKNEAMDLTAGSTYPASVLLTREAALKITEKAISSALEVAWKEIIHESEHSHKQGIKIKRPKESKGDIRQSKSTHGKSSSAEKVKNGKDSDLVESKGRKTPEGYNQKEGTPPQLVRKESVTRHKKDDQGRPSGKSQAATPTVKGNEMPKILSSPLPATSKSKRKPNEWPD